MLTRRKALPPFVCPCIALALLTVCVRSPALDPNSLRAVKQGPGDVGLSWNDPAPILTCVSRGDTPLGLSFLASTHALTFVDTPPTGTAWFYTVERNPNGLCEPCQASETIQCGDLKIGRNDQPGSTDQIDRYATCSDGDLSGPEVLYAFQAPSSVDVTAEVLLDPAGGPSLGLGVFILEDIGGGCDASLCISNEYTWGFFHAAAGSIYYIAVDGVGGNVADYVLRLDCSDDCGPGMPAACGSTLSGRNDQAGSSDVFDAYPGCSTLDLSGPEVAYALDAQVTSQRVTASLRSLSADLDILLLEARCRSFGCTLSGDTAVDFFAVPGVQYYLVVDGVAGAAGSYDLDIACAPARCSPVRALACPDSDSRRNDGPGSTTGIDWYAPSLDGWTGPEVGYEFTSNEDQFVAVRLSTVVPDLGVFVIEDRGQGCEPSEAFQHSADLLRFAAKPATRYFVVVDGLSGAAGGYTVDLSCAPPCVPAATIRCGDVVTGNNAGTGSTRVVDAYPACSARDESGPEMVYRFSVPEGSVASLSLSGAAGDLDLFALESHASGCDPDPCVAFGDQTLTFIPGAQRDFNVVVDGFQGAVSDYTLTVGCSPVQCAPAQTLACGQIVSGRNDDPGSTDVLDLAPGPEFVYSFTPAESGYVVAAFLDPSATLVAFVLEDRGNGCSLGDVVYGGPNVFAFDAVAGTTYYIGVDGPEGAPADYSITVSCGSCYSLQEVSCGDTVTGRNDAPGSGTQMDSYPACGGRDASGPDYAYILVLPTQTRVTATLTTLEPALDLYALAPWGCRAGGCMAWGDDTVVFTVPPYSFGSVVVDAPAGTAADYSLHFQCDPVQCAPGRTIACGDTLAGRNEGPGASVTNDYYPCDGEYRFAPEAVYAFTAPDFYRVQVGLQTAKPYMAAYVLADRGSGCDPEQCIGAAWSAPWFGSQPGATYYVVVDGYPGSIADYTLSLTCDPLPGCVPARAIACGGTDTWNAWGPGGTNQVDLYPACTDLQETRPEIVYTFSDTLARTVQVHVAAGAPTGIFILEDRGAGCRPETCIAMGTNDLQFNALAGQTYYIALEGPFAYTVDVTCL